MDAPREVAAAGAPGKLQATQAYLSGVRSEMKRFTWPSRDELIKATRMIVILSIVLGVVIGLVDFLLQLILVRGVAAIAG
jgi:preprotein translocase subunit SecE